MTSVAGADLGGGCRGCAPPTPRMTCGFLIQLVFCKKWKTMWFIGVEVAQETSAPPPKKNPGSAPELAVAWGVQGNRPPGPYVIIHVLVDISLPFTPRAKWSPIKSYFWSVVSLTTVQYQLLPIFLFSTHNSSMELFTTNFALCILNPVI